MIVVDRIGSEILGKVERDGAVLLRSANPVVAHVGYDMAEIIGIAILGHLHLHHLARGIGETVIENVGLRREAVGQRERLVGDIGEFHIGFAEARPLVLVVDHGHHTVGDHLQRTVAIEELHVGRILGSSVAAASLSITDATHIIGSVHPLTAGVVEHGLRLERHRVAHDGSLNPRGAGKEAERLIEI